MKPLWLLLALALAATAYFAGAVLIPLIFSLFFAILLEPLVAWCAVRGLGRNYASAAVVLVFIAAVGGAIFAAAQPFSRTVGEMPQYRLKIRAAASALERKASKITGEAAPAAGERRPEAASKEGGDGDGSWSQFVWRGLGSVVEAAGLAAFVPFLMIVMLIEKDLLLEGFKRLVGASCDIGLIQRESTQMVRAYFYGNLLAGVAMGLLHWLVFLALGLKNAVGLGLVSGLVTLIPLIGLPAALLLPLAQGLLQFERILPFALIVVSVSALHLLNANYVVPRVIGARARINSTAATVGLLFWGWLWGITGFVLAVPLTALLKILFESSRDTEGYARLLAAEPAKEPSWFGGKWLARTRRHARALAPP